MLANPSPAASQSQSCPSWQGGILPGCPPPWDRGGLGTFPASRANRATGQRGTDHCVWAGLGQGGSCCPPDPAAFSSFPVSPRPPRPGAGEPSPWAGWAVVPPNPPEPQHHTGAPWAHLSGTQGLRQGGGIAAESPGPSQQPEPGLTQAQQLLRGRKLERRLQPPPLLPPAPPAVVLV